MQKVFISRPNWVANPFQEPLSKFYGVLEGIGISPQTIGVEVTPIASPLEEVIDLMKECEATIVVGIPCIRSKGGHVKGNEYNEDKWFASEWNHIEASLSMALNKPTLILRNVGLGEVSGGVFDRGACPAFIHDINFKNPTWPQDNIGAFNALLKKMK